MQERIELDLSEIFKIMNKRKFIIGGATLIVAVLTALVNLFVLKPVYEARVSMVVSPVNITENMAFAYSSDSVVLSQKLLKTYSEIATSETVLRKTVNDLGYKLNDEEYAQFRKSVIVTTKENTQLLEINIRDNSASKASTIANKLTDNFMIESKEYLPTGEIKLLDKASVPTKPVKPSKTLNVLVATGLTFIGVSTFLLLKDLRQVKIVDENDVEKYLGLKVVGTIRQMD